MPQKFITQIDKLRRRLQRRRVVAAACWSIATLVAAALALTACDRLLDVEDFFGRALFTATFAGVCFIVGRQAWHKILRQPVKIVEVAQRIERRHPELRDLVTSSLEFSQPANAELFAGSESLRRAVVKHTSEELKDLDWQQFVSRQPLRRAMSAAGGALVVMGLLSWWAPQSLGIGLTRLINPLCDSEWPRINHLEFVAAPQTLAAGDDLVLQLHDAQGPLPNSIEMHYRVWRNQRWHEQTNSLTTAGNTQEIIRPHVQQSLEYRATGGDHRTMPWQELEVVAPPQVSEIEIRIHPKGYTGIENGPLEKKGQVLTGSGLELSGKCDQPLARVVLHGQSGLAISATIDSKGKLFHISPDIWQAETSDLLSLELTTVTGLSTRAAWRLSLEVVPDLPPEVRFVEPTSSLSVTPEAKVRLVVAVSDDLAIRNVELLFNRSDLSEQGDQSIPLFQSPELPTLSTATRQQRLEHLLSLKPLSLQPGSVVEIHARVSDYQVEVGQTRYPVRLLVVSQEDLLHDISEQDRQLLKTLERLLQEQTELHEIVTQWELEKNWLLQRWLEAFQTLSARQRLISATLANPRDGLLHSLEQLIDSYSRNQLNRQAAVDTLQALHELLSDLVENPLQDIERLLGELMRVSRQPELDSLEELSERQQSVIEILQQAVASLSLENELAKFESGLAQIEARQRELAEQSRREILNSLSQINSQAISAAAGKQASVSQSQLARQFAKLVLQMSRAIESQSVNADSLSDTVSLARDLGVQNTMRIASDHLAQQQIGKASVLQQKSIDHLHQLRKRLAEGNTSENKEGEVNTPRAGEKENSSPEESNDRREGSGEAGTRPNESAALTKHGRRRSSLKMTSQLIKDLWGNLPERQREQILQPLSETFLPKYAEEIEAYFRTLAEPAISPKDSP